MNGRRVGEIAAAAMLGMAALIALFGGREGERAGAHPRSAADEGTRALWRTLERLGKPVEIWAKEPEHLEGTGNLLLWSTTEGAASRPRAERRGAPAPAPLVAWVERGNTLALPLDHASSAADFLSAAFGLTGLSAGKENTKIPGTGIAAPQPFDTALLGLPSEARPLVGDPAEPFAAAIPRGRGTLLLLASIAPLSNGALRVHPGNLVELLPIFEGFLTKQTGARDSGRFLLDASMYGDRDYPSSLSLALGPRALPATIHVALAILVFALARGIRFGAVREPVAGPIHHQVEAASAIAALYRRAGRPELASAAVASGFAERARRALGLPHNCETAELARRVAERASIPNDRALRLLSPSSESDWGLVAQTQETLLVERRLLRREPR